MSNLATGPIDPFALCKFCIHPPVMCDAVITPSPFSATSRLVREAFGENRPALRARGSFRWAQSYPWLYTQNATPVFPRSFKPVEAQRNLGGLDEAIADWLTRKKR